MSSQITITITGQQFDLLADRALYWHREKTLIATDLHLGKSGHFRKSGIAAPYQINQTTLRRLDKLVTQTKPEKLLILGDLFHSDVNREWFQFEEWRSLHAGLDITLVAGNHDTLHNSFYSSADLQVLARLRIRDILFVHDGFSLDDDQDSFIISGHVHPGIRLKGKGRQTLRLPCFYRKTDHLIMPAYGEFTGLHVLPEKEAESVYPIADNKVFQVSIV